MAAVNNAVLNALDILDLLGRAPEGLRLTTIALEEVRGRGYAVDRGELHRDVHCVAAPIKEPSGGPSPLSA